MRDRYPGYSRRTGLKIAVGGAGLVALAACGSGQPTSSSASNTETNSTSISVGAIPGCPPDVRVNSKITIPNDPMKGTPLAVLAGIVRLPDGDLIGRPAYVVEHGRWDVATLRYIGSRTWQLVNPEPVADVNVYIRDEVKSSNDGCTPPANFDRQPQTQVVTATGDVVDTEAASAGDYLSFNNGSQDADSALAAYEDGALSVPFHDIPSGFEEVALANQH